MITSSILLASAAGTLPTGLWLHGIRRMSRMDLLHKIRTAQTLGHAATLRDHETGAHNLRVAYMASLFGETWGLNKREIGSLMKGAFLHDVGKIGISDGILLKNGALTQDELIVMRTHPEIGASLLASDAWFDDAIPIVLHHHERFDGSGYPANLSGEKIPLSARLFAIIDVFDALVSKRPYKEAFSKDRVFNILEASSGSHFDPEVVERFMPMAATFFDVIYALTELELKVLLEERRKRIIGA